VTTGPGAAEVPGGVLTRRAAVTPFEVHLDVFEGPFDLLLGLIAKHKLDITVIALAQVTDEFMAHIRAVRAADEEWDLGQASEFLLVAATLLDLKAARLLPNSGPDDEEDLALIEARDLLFARLLQYRAFKVVAVEIADRMAAAAHTLPRPGGLEPHLAALLPDLVMSVTPQQLAVIAARALEPKVPPTVGVDHLHAPLVSVREQAMLLVARLRRDGVLSFRSLVSDADSTLVVVARFLAVLELFRERVVTVEQAEALGELTVRWTGEETGAVTVSDEFDEFDEIGEQGEIDGQPEISEQTDDAGTKGQGL
jgi:segregation and condensation protein A